MSAIGENVVLVDFPKLIFLVMLASYVSRQSVDYCFMIIEVSC